MLGDYMHILQVRKSERFGKTWSAFTLDQDLVKLVSIMLVEYLSGLCSINFVC